MSDAWVFGVHAAEAVLQRTPERVRSAGILSGRDDARLGRVLELCASAGIAVERLPREALDRRTDGGNHQGVVLAVRPAEALGEADLKDIVQQGHTDLLLLVLDGVTDPHNLGACLRSADAAGVHAVIAPKDRAAGLNPTVRKVASGAAETVPFVQVTNLARMLRWLKEQGVWVVGTAGGGTEPLWDCDFSGPVAVVMGSEGGGMRRLTRELCDRQVHIPMVGTVDSLNVSVAAGVVLFEARRQRSGTGGPPTP